MFLMVFCIASLSLLKSAINKTLIIILFQAPKHHISIYVILFRTLSKMSHLTSPFHRNIDWPQRPQTPTPPLKRNKSYNQFSHLSYPHPSTYASSQANSKISAQSSISDLDVFGEDENELLTEDLIHLLRNEQKSMLAFRQKMDKEKKKVEEDFRRVKKEVENIIEDLKLSIQAQLDNIYKIFITKYAEIKKEVKELRRMKKEMLNETELSKIKVKQNNNFSTNNQLIADIENDAQQYRNLKFYGYISQIHKQKLKPILELSNDLILIGSVEPPFYQTENMQICMNKLKETLIDQIKCVYDNIACIVKSPQDIVGKEKNRGEVLKNILNESRHIAPTFQKIESYDSLKSQVKVCRNKFKNVSKSQKCAVIQEGQIMRLKKAHQIRTQHQDTILCISFINNSHIATGSKDRTIHIYNFNGRKVATLKAHTAAICHLSIVGSYPKQYLASGGDYGCCSLMLWDTESWQLTSNVKVHKAAVTCILDLEDGKHLITGSYDKKICLICYESGQLILAANNKSAVTSIVMSSDQRKLITCGIENSLLIWSVFRRNNIVESIEISQLFDLNSLICVIEPSILHPNIVYASTKDGKIKSININNGNVIQSVTANQQLIIEMAVLQRQMNQPIIFSCSCKDKNLCLTHLSTQTNEIISLNNQLKLEYGCGIGPKMVMNGGMMGIVRHSAEQKEVCLYKIELC